MNRLVIIGNGFDLAHGLPTTYRDFLYNYFNEVLLELKSKFVFEDFFYTIKIDPDHPAVLGFFDSVKSIQEVDDWVKFCNTDDPKHSTLLKNEFIIKNEFFRTLCDLRLINDWVDIENEYYQKLSDIINSSDQIKIPDNEEKQIVKLNREFEEIKKSLENYLKKIDSQYEMYIKENPFLQYIKSEEQFGGDSLNDFLEEFPFYESLEINSQLLEQKNPENNPSPILKLTNYFLNFNYTNTLKKYFDLLEIKSYQLNHLHGLIDSQENPINFGFGDEKDKFYFKIENINDNEYLKNIKSFHYLNTINYKDFIDFIDGESFQVYLMGHSCGLSDRTLLNTIFEHINCRSIKIFYHKRIDGSDNYTNLIQNISRHFKDKKIMRSKIVNKTLCQPLPQIQLPKKQNDPLP